MLAVFVHVGIGAIVFFGLWLWALLDVISTDEMLCRNVPKGMWVTLVLFIPMVGSIAWLIAGRPVGAPLTIGGNNSYETNPHRSTGRGYEDSRPRNRPAPIAPSLPLEPRVDLDISESAAVKERRLLEWEAELAKREQALADETSEPEEP